MIKTLDQVEVTELPDTDNIRTCECKSADARRCSNEAAWLYLMKCCGSQSFVCQEHHVMHLTNMTKRYYCVKCRQRDLFLAELVLKMVRL